MPNNLGDVKKSLSPWEPTRHEPFFVGNGRKDTLLRFCLWTYRKHSIESSDSWLCLGISRTLSWLSLLRDWVWNLMFYMIGGRFCKNHMPLSAQVSRLRLSGLSKRSTPTPTFSCPTRRILCPHQWVPGQAMHMLMWCLDFYSQECSRFLRRP